MDNNNESDYNNSNFNNNKSKTKYYNNFINPLLNDSTAIMSSYLYWKIKKNINGYGEFYINNFPMGGNFLFVAGIDEIISLIENFKFTINDITFLKTRFNFMELEFFQFLENLDLSDIELYGMDNGDLITGINPDNKEKFPILVLKGALVKIKLLTFPITNLLGFSSLLCTNSVRLKLAANRCGRNINLLEFGLRRAQGPLAGIFASKYSNLIFDATSNVLSSCYYSIPVKGTCAHSYIMSYQGAFIDEKNVELFNKCIRIREELNWTHTNLDELLAFISFVSVYNDPSTLLVDTYNTIESGVKNVIIVALALRNVKFIRGIRLDSGDLAQLSNSAYSLFQKIAMEKGANELTEIKISASNDINEKSINQFNKSGHHIDIYGIGTNLVTCQLQPFMEIRNEIGNAKLLIDDNMKLLFRNKQSFNEKNFATSKKMCEENYKKLI